MAVNINLNLTKRYYTLRSYLPSVQKENTDICIILVTLVSRLLSCYKIKGSWSFNRNRQNQREANIEVNILKSRHQYLLPADLPETSNWSNFLSSFPTLRIFPESVLASRSRSYQSLSEEKDIFSSVSLFYQLRFTEFKARISRAIGKWVTARQTFGDGDFLCRITLTSNFGTFKLWKRDSILIIRIFSDLIKGWPFASNMKSQRDSQSISPHRARSLNGHWKVVAMMYVTRFSEDSCKRSISVKSASPFVIECMRVVDGKARVKYEEFSFNVTFCGNLDKI